MKKITRLVLTGFAVLALAQAGFAQTVANSPAAALSAIGGAVAGATETRADGHPVSPENAGFVALSGALTGLCGGTAIYTTTEPRRDTTGPLATRPVPEIGK